VLAGDVTEELSASDDSAPAKSDQQARIPLNSRESEVIKLLVQGMTNKEIEASLNVSESVVKNTLQQLFAKTEVRTRGQLVRVALECCRDLL
jgi:two-component system, NarL family, nitrate/nitrite response regulator NarL